MQNKLQRAVFTLSVCAAAGLVLATTVWAQTGERRVMTFQQGEVFFLHELGALITSSEAGLVVELAPPPERRPPAYREVDLKEKDLVAMFNGKRVKTIAELQGRYDSLKVGEEVKLGIKRGDEMRLVVFPKVDQSTLPQTRQVMLRGDADSATAQGSGTPQQGMMMSWSGGPGDGEIVALPELGLVFTEQDSTVRVASILPNAGEVFKDNTPQEGDVIKAIGGKHVHDLDAFQKVYDEIPVGGDVQLIFIRDKKESTVSVKKAEAAPQQMMIRKQG